MGLDTSLRSGATPPHGEGLAGDTRASEFDLRDVVAMVWRAKWLMILFAAIGFGAAYAHLLRITPLYTAETRVLWDVDNTNVSGLDPVTHGIGTDFFSLSSQIEVIRSGRLLERVVDDLDLVKDPIFNANLRPPEGWTRWLSLSYVIYWAKQQVLGGPVVAAAPEDDPEKALRRSVASALGGAVDAQWLDGTYVLMIRMTTPDPRRSAELADAMANFYILDQLETKFEATRQATDWLTDRVADLRVELETAERAVEAFSSSSTLVSEEALAGAARQLKDMRERSKAIADEREDTLRSLDLIATAREADDFAAIADLTREPRLRTMADEIARLAQAGETDARAGLTVRFDAELDRTRARMSFSVDRLTGQEQTVLGTIAEMEEKVGIQSKSLVELRQLQREAEASRLIYEFFLSRLKETSVQEGIQRPDARVLTVAGTPVTPSSPRRGMTLAFGTGMGAFAAFLVIFLLERMNTSFRSTEELEARTGIAVIGTIPIAPVTRRRALLQYMVERPTSSVAEAVRNLRTSVLLANVDKPPQVIMLTSALPGEGKTTCCIALAQISRALGKKVLLIECDIRRRTFRTYFDLPERGGLLSVLSGARTFEECVYHDETSGLHVLGGEESSVNAADVFASHRFAEFISTMRKQYDFVFIDTPPVLAVPDARGIAKISDAVLFSVRWNKTSRDTVVEGLRFFHQVNIRVAGLVLSQVNMNKMARYGYSGYGYYKEAAKYYHN